MLNYKSMVSVDIIDKQYKDSLKPSSDTPTHIELYKRYEDIQSIVHTHSIYATSWEQAGLPTPCLDTTHADFWEYIIPIIGKLEINEIETNYEKNTGFFP